MKKIAASLLATSIAGVGLVAVSEAPTFAAPYPHTISTSTRVSTNDVTVGQRAKITVRVKADSNRTPKGQIGISVVGPHGYSFSATRNYSGGAEVVTTDKLVKRGRYEVTVRYVSGDRSVFKRSSDSTSFVVKRHR